MDAQKTFQWSCLLFVLLTSLSYLASFALAGTFLMTNDSGSSVSGVSFNNTVANEYHSVTADSLANIVAMSASNLSAYDVVWINPPIMGAGTYYDSLSAGISIGASLEQYAANGGTLVICVAGNEGSRNNIAPGGVDYDRTTTHNTETFTTPVHPYITGAGFGGATLVESEFNNWGATDHGWLTSLPTGVTTILSNTDGPSLVHYPWMCGHVIVTTLIYGWENAPAPESGPAAQNLIHYAYYLEPMPLIGPDNFGYLGHCTSPNLRDIRTSGTEIVMEDETISGSIPIPFNFNFYGSEVSELFISSNGFLMFPPAGTTGCCDGDPIPHTNNPDFFVAGFWEDLDPFEGGTVYYQVLGSAPHRELVVGFYSVYHFFTPQGNEPVVTFEMILHEASSNIELQYGDAPSDGDTVATTVGIENSDGTDGLQIAHGNDVSLHHQGFLITHPCPYRLAGDENFDCIHNLVDFAISTQTWLIDCTATPGDPACLPI